MFEQLVVSAREPRKRTTAKFFLGTSALYVFAVVVAFAVSVLLSDPKLADTGNILTRIARVPPALGTPPTHSGPQPQSKPAMRPDPNNVMSLDNLIARSKAAPSPVAVSDRWDSETGGGPSIGPPGVGSPFGVIGGDRTVEPPPIPDPPKPKAPAAAPTTLAETRPVHLSSTVLQGKATARVVPVYPELPRRIRMPGEVSVEVIISPDGRVESTRIVSGHPMFVMAALQAARGWRFEPTLLNGVAVRVTGVITFVFKLNE
jgi:TonB family protein